MGKGHTRRPSAVSATDFATNWDRTFGPDLPSYEREEEDEGEWDGPYCEYNAMMAAFRQMLADYPPFPQTDSAKNVAEGQSKGQCASVHSAKSMPGKGLEPL